MRGATEREGQREAACLLSSTLVSDEGGGATMHNSAYVTED